MTTAEVQTGYPITVTFDPPERVPRWMPIISWLLAIPHMIVLYVLMIVAEVLLVVGWFCGVIAGRIPEGIVGFVAGVDRYRLRVATYLMFVRGSYPAFGGGSSLEDPGTDPVVRIDYGPAVERRSRVTIFFRLLLVLPHYIVLSILGIALYVVMIIGWFAVLILGRWPEGMRDFVLGYLRWSTRVTAYYMLVTDDYPPFSLH